MAVVAFANVLTAAVIVVQNEMHFVVYSSEELKDKCCNCIKQEKRTFCKDILNTVKWNIIISIIIRIHITVIVGPAHQCVALIYGIKENGL